jgi:hypothetical protein
MGYMNAFRLQVATSCRSEWDTTTNRNSRNAFSSDPVCPSCFDVGVHLGQAPASDPDWDPRRATPSVRPMGPLTLHIRASLRGEVAPTTLVGTNVPMGISALGEPLRYPWPGDGTVPPEGTREGTLLGSIAPLPNSTVSADIALVVQLANDTSAATMSLYIYSATACGLNPASPYLQCLLGPGEWGPNQQPCPLPGLARTCNATAWAVAPNVTTQTNPVAGSVPLVRAYLPVLSRGITRTDLCRLSTRDALQRNDSEVIPGSTPEFMCPGLSPRNATLETASYCGSGVQGSGWQWPTFQGVNGSLPGMDALHVPLGSLPPGPVAFMLTATAAGCHMQSDTASRRLATTDADTHPRRLGSTASSWDTLILMLGDGGPGIGTSPSNNIPSIHTANTTIVFISDGGINDPDSATLSIMWPIAVFATLLLLITACVAITQYPRSCPDLCCADAHKPGDPSTHRYQQTEMDEPPPQGATPTFGNWQQHLQRTIVLPRPVSGPDTRPYNGAPTQFVTQ